MRINGGTKRMRSVKYQILVQTIVRRTVGETHNDTQPTKKKKINAIKCLVHIHKNTSTHNDGGRATTRKNRTKIKKDYNRFVCHNL